MLGFLGLFLLSLLALVGTLAGALLMIGGPAFALLAVMLPTHSVPFGRVRLPLAPSRSIPIGFAAAVVGLALYIVAGATFAALLP